MTGNWQKLTVCSVVSLPDFRSIINVPPTPDHYTYSGISVALYLLLPYIMLTIVVVCRLMESDGKKFNVLELGDQAGHYSIASLPV
jgi:hypothetical protein